MTTIIASTLQDVLFSGEDPLAPAHGRHLLAAAQVGDKVRLNKIYAGAKVHHARLVNGALGASTTVSLGYEYADGSGGDPVAFFNAQATNAAGANTSVAAPVVIPKDAYIVATIGGGAASGQIDSVLLYEPRGI
ncbi:hypothetical protein BKK79_00980 [Cupriavidus sp. USMAA2-4]|uniref:hypothetical protein n=1 Tax=Cupriavidus sp. USMAA2-4 TaxID=876364 RepID=UPI0008A689FE|nr:hypothetical protein [Cupriavidus sp. USMAA2-4]AOY90559.1 hypothetical protein BKK79_00980 [Cupriavidus sp. USMAA2-4]